MKKILFIFRVIFFSALILCSVLLAGCNMEKSAPAADINKSDLSAFGSEYSDISCPDCNVILISIDTLRADHLGTYGYYRNTSQNIDALAEQSFVFENAFTVVAATKPSTTSMLFGLYPYNTGIRSNWQIGPPKINDNSLPTELEKEGYTSAAFIGAQWLYPNQSGFDKYFDYFYPTPSRSTEIAAGNLTAQAIGWLQDNHNEKFFMWVHYKDPHVRYEPPVEYRNVFKSDDIDLMNMSLIIDYKVLTPAYVKDGMTDANYYRDQYDNEIFYTDEMIGGFIRKIEDLGLKNNTVIIITADHGEGLGEHYEYFGHSDYYEVTNKIPLILYLPNYNGKRIDALSANIDIFPTILNLLNMTEPKNIDGVSLVPSLTNKLKVRDYVFMEYYDPAANKSYDGAVRDENNNFIINYDGSTECYNLIKDPDELNRNGCTKEKYDKMSSYIMNELKKSGSTAYLLLQNKTVLSGNEQEKEALLMSLNYIG